MPSQARPSPQQVLCSYTCVLSLPGDTRGDAPDVETAGHIPSVEYLIARGTLHYRRHAVAHADCADVRGWEVLQSAVYYRREQGGWWAPKHAPFRLSTG